MVLCCVTWVCALNYQNLLFVLEVVVAKCWGISTKIFNCGLCLGLEGVVLEQIPANRNPWAGYRIARPIPNPQAVMLTQGLEPQEPGKGQYDLSILTVTMGYSIQYPHNAHHYGKG